ncbi:hypothetical protein CRYUN_Cryun21dG0022500 [Craigia yunnanensis]
MGVEDSKHGFEEEQAFVDLKVKDKPCCKVELKCSVADIIPEKLKKYSITGVVRLDKLKSLMLPRSPGVDQFKLWALGITTMMLLLWVLHCNCRHWERLLAQRQSSLNRHPRNPEVHSNHSQFGSQFKDIWDVDYFIKSLSDEVRIIKLLPPRLRKKVQRYALYSKTPVSWSNMSYYYNTVFPRFQKYEVVHFTKTETRLSNNLPVEVQKMRCRVNYEALRFTPAIEEVGKKIIKILRDKGPFLVLDLRYEKDMLAFSGCTEGCNEREVEELTRLRYAIPWWKEKEIDPKSKREAGLCPLTPKETALALRAFDINPNIQIYIAAGDIHGGERRLSGLRAFYPNLVKKETLLPPSDLKPFQNYSNQMAALDYLVSLDSDIFLPTYGGNMAKVVEGHGRFLGYKITVGLDRLVLISLIDQYKNGTLNWNEFSQSVKAAHANRMGSPSQRLQFPGKPKQEDYFYTNPQECLPPLVVTTNDRKPVTDKGQLS